MILRPTAIGSLPLLELLDEGRLVQVPASALESRLLVRRADPAAASGGR
jgi:hypothetical protein